jgi:hypothetical protein
MAVAALRFDVIFLCCAFAFVGGQANYARSAYTAARCIAFDPDGVEPGPRILDREGETEGASIVGRRRLPALLSQNLPPSH